MPTFKLEIPSSKTESGVEVTRWNPRLPDEKITLELLVNRLRDLIDTPTSGYNITWTDGNNTHDVNTTENLHEAIRYFSEQKSSTDKCVRLKAVPKDTLDLFTALEMLSGESTNDVVRPASGDSPDQVMGFQLVDVDERVKKSKPVQIVYMNSTDSKNQPDRYERERRRRVQARLRISHQTSISIAPLESHPANSVKPQQATPTQCLIYDRREQKNDRSQPKQPIVGNLLLDHEPNPSSFSSSSSSSSTTSSFSSTSSSSQTIRTTNATKTVPVATIPTTRVNTQTTVTGQDLPKSTKLTRDQVDELLRKLYMMGFRYEEKLLRQTIRNRQGNMNEIIDDLSKMDS